MFEKTLVKGSKDILASLGRSGILKNAYLAGGTAVALQLGHRISVDFDFFTAKDFIPKIFSTELAKVGLFKEEQADKGTVLGKFKGVNFSLFVYEYPLLYATLKYLSVDIADIRDIAVMKIDAIAARGAKRDFIDLYFICKSVCSLEQVLNFYDKKYKKLASNLIHLHKSLIYFEDADSEEMPLMIKKTSWEQVKKYFENETRRLMI